MGKKTTCENLADSPFRWFAISPPGVLPATILHTLLGTVNNFSINAPNLIDMKWLKMVKSGALWGKTDVSPHVWIK